MTRIIKQVNWNTPEEESQDSGRQIPNLQPDARIRGMFIFDLIIAIREIT
jgi:hypothetical protein